MESDSIVSRFSPNIFFMFVIALASVVILALVVSTYAAANKSQPVPALPVGSPPQIYAAALNGKYLASGPTFITTASQPGSYASSLVTGIRIAGDFAFQAQIVIQGDAGGLLFRIDQGQGDRFSIGTDGTYKLINSQGVLLSGTSAAINTGQKATNLLSVVVQGQEIYLYVNQKFVAKTQDTATKNTGQVGCQALDISQLTFVTCKNVAVFSSTSFVFIPTPDPSMITPPSSGGNGGGSGSGGSGSGDTGAFVSDPQIAQGVFSKLNQDRASYGLPDLQWSTALVASAHQHNLAMANANLMEHQVPGEADLGTRISAQGVSWTYIEENIGWTTDQSQAGALSIHEAMMNEVPPDDGHRTNILSSGVSYIGIDILIDPVHGKLWLTEDFAQFS